MNFGSLIALSRRNCFAKMKSNNGDRRKLRPLIQKTILTLIALSLTSVWLKRIYEVPYYVTDINIVDYGWRNNIGNSGFTILLSRDYSRGNNFKDVPKFQAKGIGETTGGLFIRGKYVRDVNGGSGEWGYTDSLIERSYELVNKQLGLSGQETYRRKDEVDSATRQILSLRNDPEKMVSVFVLRTLRQTTALYDKGFGSSHQIVFPGSYYYFNTAQSYTITDTLKWIKNLEKVGKKVESTEIFITSFKDSICPIDLTLFGPDYAKQNIITTAEDVSKITERIRFNTYLDKEISKKHPDFFYQIAPIDSLIVEYYGYTEFSPSIYPVPDSISLSAIYYWNKEKLKYIINNDLTFHAHFPDMDNSQEAKIFIMSMLITMFIGILGDLFYRLFLYKIFEHKKFSWILTIILLIVGLYLCFNFYTRTPSNSQEMSGAMKFHKLENKK